MVVAAAGGMNANVQNYLFQELRLVVAFPGRTLLWGDGRNNKQLLKHMLWPAVDRSRQCARPAWIKGRPLEHQRAHDSSGTSSGVLTPLMAELCIAHLHVC